ncbi:ROK family protein [Bacillus sp. mrc49]|uniref:ROK family protein n=1 Tax=Bacillus sp. mrc49 TaxID=2054913 RepID=UPI000C27263E|nr:ROK family protein [Bacillus sp. mrc49]PJN88825.1 fructokinase [Bacillus sp. mrc49]
MRLYGAIEAGGTKFVCAVGDEKGNVRKRIQIPTTVPEETIPEVIRFFSEYELVAIGIGSFGPVNIDPASPAYGNITTTPKPGWKDFPFLQTIKKECKVPVGFHTDVNAAALGEARFGAAAGMDSCLYITVGTGIGAGAVVGGRLLEGLSHPEMGHIMVRKHPEDSYKGKCPFHGDCLEGLASGPSIEERWGKPAGQLADRHEVWELEAYYLAQAIAQYILILSPKKIILGGGVGKQESIFQMIRNHVKEVLKGYVSLPELETEISDYIVKPGLGDDAGIIGSLLLADLAYQKEMKLGLT